MLDAPDKPGAGKALPWANASDGNDGSSSSDAVASPRLMFSASLVVGAVTILYFLVRCRKTTFFRNIASDISIFAFFFLRRIYVGSDSLSFAAIPWLELGGLGAAVVLLAGAVAYWRYARGRGWINKDGLVLPCETYHTRTRPKRHDFKYSYLFVWVPVWVADNVPETADETGRYWMFADARDHLYRGDGRPEKLKAKLERYLRDEGVNPADYSEAYLVTAPTILGHQFNPVSFWYLYKEAGLAAMVLEVNNTFDERRMYFLDRSGSTAVQETALSKFRHAFPKDFHVSPFNSRKGSYRLDAADPILAGSRSDPRVDNRITLVSSDGDVKFFARVSSLAKAVNPNSESPWTVREFLARWWWTGKVTYLRILREAFRLFFARRLHVWFRPEVKATSIGRRPTAAELRLERYFRFFLQETVERGDSGVVVDYKSVSSEGTQTIRISPRSPNGQAEILRIEVLSPEFYSRIVRFEDVLEGLLSEMSGDRSAKSSTAAAKYLSQLDVTGTNSDDKTISISSADLLVRLFEQATYPPTAVNLNPVRKAASFACRALRPKAKLHDESVKRRLRALDKVANSHDLGDGKSYTRDALESILSARLAFGDPTILWSMFLLTRLYVIWHVAYTMHSSLSSSWLLAIWDSKALGALLAWEMVRVCI